MTILSLDTFMVRFIYYCILYCICCSIICASLWAAPLKSYFYLNRCKTEIRRRVCKILTNLDNYILTKQVCIYMYSMYIVGKLSLSYINTKQHFTIVICIYVWSLQVDGELSFVLRLVTTDVVQEAIILFDADLSHATVVRVQTFSRCDK